VEKILYNNDITGGDKMSKKALALYFDVSIRTINRWLDRGLPHEHVYHGLRKDLSFNLEVVQNWLKSERRG
jgi:phage terminase Nu1 subunit (DNA packaging protein)